MATDTDTRTVDLREAPGTDAAHHAPALDTPTDIPRRRWTAIARRVKDRMADDQVGLIAAGVAFKAFLSLVPVIVAAISVYGLALDPATVAEQVQRIASNLPSSASGVIEQQASQIAASTSTTLGLALAASIAGALWSASGGVTGLMEGLDTAYGVDEDRSFPKKRGTAILLAIGGLLLGAILLAALLVVPRLAEAAGITGLGLVLVDVARWSAVAVFVIASLAVVYRVGPDRRNPGLRWTAPGAAIATVLWMAGTAVFAWAVAAFGSFNETYGSLAGVVVLMLWLYLSAAVALLGGYVGAEVEREANRL